MTTPHTHRDVIIAWANGETIQIKGKNGEWFDCTSAPAWLSNSNYRIKPKDIIKYMYISSSMHTTPAKDCESFHNLKLIFNAEAEVINVD